jgi:methylphosphotriester-DNA--protein-cysteine methyltransferase
MDLDPDVCYRAIQTRDARFDGRLFVAVKTTGIYCRPVCPARTPLRQNVGFHATAASAEEAGYRACLRCRPETSPQLGAWNGASNTVSRALALIEAGALDEGDVETLAERVGVGGRQLRRLFLQHLGATPVGVAQTRRVLLAKQLIHETDLPMAEVALAAGFGSVRRFNETFQQLYDRPPAALRRRKAAPLARDGPGRRGHFPDPALPAALRLGRHAGLPGHARHSGRRGCREQRLPPGHRLGRRDRNDRRDADRRRPVERGGALPQGLGPAAHPDPGARGVRPVGRPDRDRRGAVARSAT